VEIGIGVKLSSDEVFDFSLRRGTDECQARDVGVDRDRLLCVGRCSSANERQSRLSKDKGKGEDEFIVRGELEEEIRRAVARFGILYVF
jgi:hypothetical protein